MGDETLVGVGVYHLRTSASHTSSGAVGTPTTTTTTNDIYIRRDTAHPYKIITHFTSGPAGTLTNTITVTFTAYDTGVTIDLPQV